MRAMPYVMLSVHVSSGKRLSRRHLQGKGLMVLEVPSPRLGSLLVQAFLLVESQVIQNHVARASTCVLFLSLLRKLQGFNPATTQTDVIPFQRPFPKALLSSTIVGFGFHLLSAINVRLWGPSL